VEFLLGNSIPFALGLTLLGAHGYTWLAWTVWRIGETITGIVFLWILGWVWTQVISATAFIKTSRALASYQM
jgi:hypothetical protein